MSIMSKIKKGMGVKGTAVDAELEKMRNDREYENAYNDVAMYHDMRDRFKDYEKDVSVGNMYQRKKKSKKAKTKRKSKGCGCK